MSGVEPAIVQRAREGDRDAFAAIVQARWGSLVRLARSVVGDGDAEDAVQDALVVAWNQLSKLRDLESCAAWLNRIALRTCLRRARWRWRWLPLEEAPEGSVESRPEDTIDIQRMLLGLAPRQRAVLHLTVIEGMTDREIADLMSITAASVRSHRRRARQSLERIHQQQQRVAAGRGS
ncbi:MAG: sigma-70 family RNA polymerase sigma factor [Deltaproteobacteria bacterium]|nr:sigma-70 family RNA polymerase sigma factor [Deltaproteobacteria bacterium]